MPELNHYQQYVVEEFVEEYQARRLSRRDLLRRTTYVMGSLSAATAVLATMGCGGDDDDDGGVTPAAGSPATTAATAASSPAATVASASPSPAAAGSPAAPGTAGALAISFREVTYPGPAGELKGHLAQPTAAGRYPAVIVIHENQGLLDHFRDVAQRFAKEGFVALAVDLASRKGGSKADGAQNTGLLTQTEPGAHAADVGASAKYLLGLPNVRAGGVGITGFCFGGGITFEAASTNRDFLAAVPFYGTATNVLDQLKTTSAAFLVMYGGDDARITGQQDQVRAALQASGKPFDIRVYPGAAHAFFNETKPVYNEAAAKDSWARMLDWFRQYLPKA